MKIKINNIFKNKENKNYKIYTRRRRNKLNTGDVSKDIHEENSSCEKDTVESIEYKRTGAKQNNRIDFFDRFKTIKKSYYVLFGFMVILASVSIYTNFRPYNNLNEEDYEVFGNIEEGPIESSISEELQDETSNNIDTRIISNDNSTSGQIVNNTNIKEVVPEKEVVIPLSFVKPLNGEIIKEFSLDKLLYSKTLEAWKTHNGVDISGKLGDKVKSIEKGMVERIYEDSFFGTTVIIDHGQGYKSIYSNLDNKVSVKEKQTVSKSTVIGKVGKTAIGEIKDPPHIHFILMFNNKVIDPTSKIKF